MMASVQGRNNRTVMKENEEDLALFFDLPKLDQDINALNLIDNAHDLDGSHTGSSPVSKIVVPAAPARKTAMEEFLNSENGKDDHDWLLSQPGSPLLPSMAMGMEKTMLRQKGVSNARPTAKPMSSLSDSLSLRNITSSNAANKRSSSAAKYRPSTPTGQPALLAKVKPTRPTTPTPTLRRPTPPSNPKTKTSGARSSTPTARLSAPASKATSKPATLTRRPLTPSSVSSVSAPPRRSSSVTKSAPTTKNQKVLRGVSPPVKSRPWKPSEMPISSINLPSNIRTQLSERPSSTSKGRSGVSKNSDYVSPVLIGTQMVERVINMRKVAPPNQDNNSSGFGRTLSKSSLDMAIRHMGIRRSNSGNLRPIMTKNPASVCSVISGDRKSRTFSVSDSPLATSSSASSSEPSINYNTNNVDGSETGDDDIGIPYFASQQGR